MRKLYLPLLACLMLLSQNSCIPDIQDVKLDDWQPEVAIPLLNTQVTIQDLLDNFETGGFLEQDADNFLTVVYQGNVLSQKGEEIISLEDFSIPMLVSEQTIPYADLPFDVEITKVVLKEGSFDYSLQSNFTEDMDVTIQIPSLKKDGQMLAMDMVMDYTGNGAVVMNNSMDLQGYTMDFSNGLEMKYIAKKQGNNQKEQLNNVSFSFSNLKYSYVEGKFGQYVFSLPIDSLVLDIFNNVSNGNIYFESPRIQLNIKNSFGMPIRITSNNFTAQTLLNGQQNITTPLNAGVDLAYPSLAEVGQYKSTAILLDKNSSNLANIIASSPTQINYEFTALANPVDVNLTGFAKDDSAFEVDVDVELPLWFRAGNFTYEKTTDFDLSDIDQIEELEFKLITKNGLPLDTDMQLYFEDANGNVLDSLLTNNQSLLVAADVDNNGKVTASGDHTELVSFTGARIQNIQRATKIRLKAELSTANMGATSVKLFADYESSFQLGVKAILKP